MGNSSFQFLGIPPKGERFSVFSNQYGSRFGSFQFLGIPPKGELQKDKTSQALRPLFPISRDPPEGGTSWSSELQIALKLFPISRDPPEGGTWSEVLRDSAWASFPISRDPPEGGTSRSSATPGQVTASFQFLGIPPKGEHFSKEQTMSKRRWIVSNF